MAADTIFALASGRPPAAISIVRVSGPLALEAGRQLAGSLPEARQAALRELRHPESGQLLDHALVLRFDAPASSTGEHVVELHCHGGRAVVDAVLGALGSAHGLRAALPGEFTRRAFENGRIDLTEAEGLADLIEAQTDSQRRAALALAAGGLRRQIEDWLERLLGLSARAEAAIDYAEEDEVATDPQLSRDCSALATELVLWLERPRVEPLKDGVRVVIAGPVNAGKSSLFNVIAGHERAIVSDIPGTTRDHIELPLSLAGIPIILSDTAGLRDAKDPVERIGIERAQAIIERADILLWLGDPARAPDHPQVMLIHPQCDRPDRALAPSGSLAVSSVTGRGLDAVLRRIAELATGLLPAEDAVALNRRQALQLGEASSALREAADTPDHVLVAEHLRLARQAFGRLSGRAGIEDVLDSLFGRFCLGK